jgi:hypothetical protein
MKFDKNEIKNSLTIEQVEQFLAEHGGEPVKRIGTLVSRTICHNPADGQGSYKLYYYENTHLFKCYTGCAETSGFDIFDLTRKIMKIQSNIDFSLYDAEIYVINFFALDVVNDFSQSLDKNKDFIIFNQYEKNKRQEKPKKRIEFQNFDSSVLKWLPHPKIVPWLNEGISQTAMDTAHICFDPYNYGIVIPHYDIDGHLIGIREITLVKENEDKGKYMPAILNGKMYNHPLGFNLYNLNHSKDNIKNLKIAILGEGEKFCLSYMSFFGINNDISVACCGSNLTTHQYELLEQLGVEEIVIAFDKQFQTPGDEEWKKWIKKLQSIYDKYNKYIKISFMFDTNNILKYKQSPTDGGKEVFLELFNHRITLD